MFRLGFRFSYFVLVAVLLVLPLAASAQQVHFPYWGTNPPILPCTGLECVDLCQLLLLFQRLIYFGMTVAVLFVAPILILWGAFLIIVSGGSAERVGKGKTVLTSTIIGIVITLGAFLMVSTFLWFLGNPASGGVSWPNIACSVQATTPPPAAAPPPASVPPAASLPTAPPASPLLSCGADNGTSEGANGTCPDSRAECILHASTGVTARRRVCVVPEAKRVCGEVINGNSMWAPSCPVGQECKNATMFGTGEAPRYECRNS